MAQSLILKKLSDLGQSVWYDNISRELIQSGGLSAIVANGVTGLTSNPSILYNPLPPITPRSFSDINTPFSGKKKNQILKYLSTKFLLNLLKVIIEMDGVPKKINQETGGFQFWILLT